MFDECLQSNVSVLTWLDFTEMRAQARKPPTLVLLTEEILV